MGEEFRVIDFCQHFDILHKVNQVICYLCQRFTEKFVSKVTAPVIGAFLDEILKHNVSILPLFLESHDSLKFCPHDLDVLLAAVCSGRYLRQLGQTFCETCTYLSFEMVFCRDFMLLCWESNLVSFRLDRDSFA